MNFIQENQIYRFQILLELYQQSKADIDFVCDLQVLSTHKGIGLKPFQSAYKYLYMQDLIHIHPTSPTQNDTNSYLVSITHKGIKALEEVFRDITKPTEYFPSYREMMM
jgi:hypothetical protein